ncbi:GNAT family N-acetyltransferase [Rhodopirellula sp. MGV]|uniref:GNAT family N-acetyltransferase n=1 Tax=Rhodopirellula sp. MGV TaxID=2023130 RepID=UPI000B96D2F1|nr:GNAT family N-acetyltransferase [Rhodopirellula sp. MGV]OYP36729.1 GNAT family N-acetyltransferase [Rhodopirellula sp. MGV]PNY34422.1 N-acetyltransferase [Rhodopirellula baltica]
MTTTTGSEITIRDAQRADVPQIHAMLGELAEFEKLSEQFVGTAQQMETELFDRDGGPSAFIAVDAECGPIAYAIYFENFSTFLCRRGLYLEDIYVRPAFRKRGIGKRMLQHLASIAVERQCGRMEWCVLDWNQNAIDVYEAIGGDVLPDWRIVRLDQDAIAKLAGK